MVSIDLKQAMATGAEAYAIRAASTRAERLAAIQRYYRAGWKIVKQAPRWQWALDPHEVGWEAWFTPIESAVWSEIRQAGVVLYPQHPVGRFFVDFGHPVARVALECDGKQFHRGREALDRERQAEIEAFGWTVYRLSGADCLRVSRMVDDDDACTEQFAPGPAMRLLEEIGARHGLSARLARRAAA